MKKIGILTYHHVVNIGSILQSWSVYKLLSTAFPHDRVEIIDYIPSESSNYNWVNRQKGGLRGKAAGWLKEKRFRRFLQHECHFSQAVPPSNAPGDIVSHLSRLEYDFIFVGSDTVFQMDGYFGAPIAGPPPPNAYFLPSRMACTKVGFAVSADPVVDNRATAQRLDSCSRWLQDFDAILFRDDDTRALLKSGGVPDSKLSHIPDPTILQAQAIADLSKKRPTRTKRPLPVGVYVGHDSAPAAIIDELRARGVPCVDIIKNAPITMRSNPIADYVEQFGGLSGLITDRFHGTIIATIVGDYPILGLCDLDRYPRGGKLRDLYSRLGICNQLLGINFSEHCSQQIAASWVSLAQTPSTGTAQSALHDMTLQGRTTLDNLFAELDMQPGTKHEFNTTTNQK